MKYIRTKHRGFTIIELMIATTIFALVLMIALSAILNITRTYNQGTLQAKVQNRAREVVDEIADEIRYRPGEFIPAPSGDVRVLPDAPELDDASMTVGSVDPRTPENYFSQFCIGSIRYRYLLGFKTTEDAILATTIDNDREASRPLKRDYLPGGCTDEYELMDRNDVVGEFIQTTTDNSLLDENMSVLQFDVTKIGLEEKYRVAVTIAYGDDDMIGYENGNFICRPNNPARAYCAISSLEVIATRRFD